MNIGGISTKQIVFASFLSAGILLLIMFRALYRGGGYIYLCSEQSALSIVVEDREGNTLLISDSSVRNIIDCLGRTMPFNKRSIEYTHITNTEKREGIEKRYTVVNDTLPKEFAGLSIEKRSASVYHIYNVRNNVVVLSKFPSSPFEALQGILDDSPTVYIPHNSAADNTFVESMIAKSGGMPIKLKSGNFMRHEVSR